MPKIATGQWEAQRVYFEEIRFKARNSKARTRPDPGRWNHIPHFRGVGFLEADEVLNVVASLGIRSPKTKREYSKRTLRDYAKKNLVPKPDTRSLGRNVGRVSYWSKDTPYEFFASHKLIHGNVKWPVDKIGAARDRALRVWTNPDLLNPRLAQADMLTGALAINWLIDKERAEAGILKTDARVELKNLAGEWEKVVTPSDEGVLIIEWRKGDRIDRLSLRRFC